jgi:uncharacterized protein (TIGR03083 family)
MSDQATTPTALVGTLTASWQALSDLGAGLTDEQWKTPTDLPGWSVQDTLAHVIGTERMLAGFPAPDPLPGDSPPHVRNPIGDLNEREVAARRSRSGAEVLVEWDELRAERQQRLDVADAAYFAQPMETPTGPGTMRDFLSMRVLDCWVHEQDIRRAVGLRGTYTAPAAAHTVDRLARSLPMVIGKRAACPEGAAVQIELTGPIERRYVCEVTDGRAAFVESSSRPQTTVSMDTECYVLLATGRRTPDDLDGRFTVTGDAELGARVLDGMNVLF